MANFKLIDVPGAKQLLEKENVKLVDIRDEHSFETDHVEGSFHLTNASIGRFMEDVSMQNTILVLCYHGNSSKGVAQYLYDQGYQDVYSVNGGFDSWRIGNL